MQSIFIACYLCLQLIALNNNDQAALAHKDSSCDQCLTGVTEKLHLAPELATQVEDWLSVEKPTTEILSNNPALADAIAKLIQDQITPSSQNVENPASPASETQNPTGFLGKTAENLVKPKPTYRSFLRKNEKLHAGESLMSVNQKYFATLDEKGQLMVTRADGTFLENMGCPPGEPMPDFNVVFTGSGMVYYKTDRADDSYCASVVIPRCEREGVRCYLNLDDDGRLRIYSGDGVFEYSYTSRRLTREEEMEGVILETVPENSQEIEYKGRNTLKRNERLRAGESLVSENGKFKIMLTPHGEFFTVDSRGKIIRNSGSCDIGFPYSYNWNYLMGSDNSLTLYSDMKRDLGDFACSTGIPMTRDEYYLKLGNDGILRMVNDKGQVLFEWTYNKFEN